PMRSSFRGCWLRPPRSWTAAFGAESWSRSRKRVQDLATISGQYASGREWLTGSNGMLLRAAVALTGLLAVAPAFAEPMNAEFARRFVAGKLFTFTCFEGSTGTGRIFNDGSVAGVMRVRADGPTRFMHLPPGTLYPKEGRICSNVKGAFFNPCFELRSEERR